MDNLSIKQKVEFAVRRITEIPFQEGRMVIEYWDNFNEITELLNMYNMDYNIVRGHKRGHMTPGVININAQKKFNPDFLRKLLTGHYGFDFSLPGCLHITPYVIIDTGLNEVIAIKLYDDRGFYEYYLSKKRS